MHISAGRGKMRAEDSCDWVGSMYRAIREGTKVMEVAACGFGHGLCVILREDNQKIDRENS